MSGRHRAEEWKQSGSPGRGHSVGQAWGYGGALGGHRGVCVLCGVRAVATGPVPRHTVFPSSCPGRCSPGAGAAQGVAGPLLPRAALSVSPSLPANYLHVDKTLYPKRLLPGLAASSSRGRHSPPKAFPGPGARRADRAQQASEESRGQRVPAGSSVPAALCGRGRGRNWQPMPDVIEVIIIIITIMVTCAQVLVPKHHCPIKGIRAPWKNG